MAAVSSSTPYAPTASRALSYLTERAEDAQAAIRGILGGVGPGAAGPSGADRYLGGVELGGGEQGVKLTRIKLESSLEQDRLDGLRTVVAMISKSLPASNHLFPSVLKLTSAQSLQVKTLVYLVTLRLAPSQPDVALLSINSFQRDLSDPSPLIRGMALRVLSGLGVKMAAPLMEMAIAKGVRDPSFYVRRIAADAVGKCYELSRSTLPALLPHLSTLLSDRHPSVLGSTMLAFNCTVPDRYDLLHPHFRRICHGLVDIDEWNQPVTLRVLAGYAKTFIKRPSANESANVLEEKSEKVVPGRTKWGTGLDKDLELLLSKAEPLLLSRNAAVVLTTAYLYLSLLPIASPRQQDLAQPLLRLIRGHPCQAHIVLLFIRRLLSLRPELFSPHSLAFIPLSSVSDEPSYITEQKLDVLVDLAVFKPTKSAIKLARSELDNAALNRSESSIVVCAVRGLGRLVSSIPQTESTEPLYLMEHCTETLLSLLKTRGGRKTGDRVVSASMDVLRMLIKSTVEKPRSLTAPDTAATSYTLYRLSTLLFKASSEKPSATATGESSTSAAALVGKSSIADSSGRANIYWLLGQFCREELKAHSQSSSGGEGVVKTLAEVVLPDVLRKGCLNFNKESAQAKLSLLALSSKLHAFLPTTSTPPSVVSSVAKLHAYILQLGRYDLNHDVRDRARYYQNLTAGLATGEANVANGTDVSAGPYDVMKESEEGASSSSGGVRLRREQVLLVLFGDQTPNSVESADSRVDPLPIKSGHNPSGYLDPLRLLLLPHSSEDSSVSVEEDGYEGSLPIWTANQDTLPPSSIRDPTTGSSSTSTSLSHLSSTNPSLNADVRSVSSNDPAPAASSPAITNVTRRTASSSGKGKGKGKGKANILLPPSVDSTATSMDPRGDSPSPALGNSTLLLPGTGGGGMESLVQMGKGRYKDLDDFLNEESEEESSDSSSDEGEDEEEVVGSSSEEEGGEEEGLTRSSEEEFVDSDDPDTSESSSSSGSDDEDGDVHHHNSSTTGASSLLPVQNEWAI